MKTARGSTPHTEIADTVEEYLSRHGVRENTLAGKGVLLRPPFSFDSSSKGALTTVNICGSDNSARFECTRVVTSRYRPNISFVQDVGIQAPLIRRLTPLQPARLKLLNCIKPMSKLNSKRFYERSTKQTGETQVNARRRWGELRTEYGFDTTYEDGSKMFRRGDLLPIEEPNPRPSMHRLNKDFWQPIYTAHQGQCAKCGNGVRFRKGDEGNPGLLDHRQPVPYGGGDEIENLQLLCGVCNNLKNTVCQACPIGYRCETCTWAFPEKFHDTIVIPLSPKEARELVRAAANEDRSPLQFAQELFRSSLQDATRRK